MKKLLITLLIITLLSSIFAYTAYSALTTSKAVTSNGRIVTTLNLGIYSDSACRQTLSTFNWGNLTAGTSANYTIYVKNTGTAKQTLSLNASNWSPANTEQYMTVTWDKNNSTLTVNQVMKATLTLTVSASIDSSITTFSNRITITGTN